MRLKHLNVSKATSEEDFPTWVSVEGREDICTPLQDIINTMLSSLQFPDKWKRAQISPIPKTPHPSKLKDYRPISLLFHLGKLAEDIIIEKLRHKLQLIIEPSQYAYQCKLGTVDALIQLLDDYTHYLDQPDTKYVQSASLDFSKAFDKLQPAILLRKMEDYGFNPNVVLLIQDFLTRRTQCVKYGGEKSSYINLHVGSPQGTKIGPVLWLIYSNDLRAEGFNHIKYADDTTFFAAVKNTEEHSTIAPAIKATIDWSENNNMQLNTDKTVVMNTCLSHRNTYDTSVKIGEVSLTPSPSTRFLGVIIDYKLTFSNHTSELTAKCNSRIFLMRKLRTLGLSNDGLKTFYLTNIRSVICYAAPAWFCLLLNHDKNKLESIQRTATKIILPDVEYADRLKLLGIPLLTDFMFFISANHFSSIRNNPSHPLHSRLSFNSSARKSARTNTTFHPPKCRTQKRSNSFFNFFMTFYNNNFMYKH